MEKLFWVTVGVYADDANDALTKTIHPNENVAWSGPVEEDKGEICPYN